MSNCCRGMVRLDDLPRHVITEVRELSRSCGYRSRGRRIRGGLAGWRVGG